MTGKALVSAIVPAYNAERTLERCVRSLLAQTRPELEVIVVDDGSSDGTAALLDGLAAQDGRVKALHKANGGVSSARNLALGHATGDWVAFVDADDWVEPEFLERLLSGPECDLAVAGYHTVGAHEIKEESYEAATATTPEAMGKLLEAHLTDMTFLCPWGKLLRRSLIEEAGLEFPTDMRLGEDTVFVWGYLARCGSVALRPGQPYNYLTGYGEAKYNIDADTALSTVGRIFGRLDALAERTGMDGDKARDFILNYYIWQFKVNVKRNFGWRDRGKVGAFFRTPLIYGHFRVHRRQSADKMLVYALLRLHLAWALFIIIKLYYR